MKSLSCKDLGNPTCQFVAAGDTVSDVVEKMKEHAMDVHKNDMEEMQKNMTSDQIDDMMASKVKDETQTYKSSE